MQALARRWIESPARQLFLDAGGLALLLLAFLRDLPTALRRLDKVLYQMLFFGVQSFGITIFIAVFTGFVVSFQTGREMANFGLAENIGSIVGIAVAREMAPVFTAFVIAGRVGAAMAAELGTMSVTDEVDALRSMGISPIHYLVVPRVLAGTAMMPLLTAFATFFAFWGGAVVADALLNVSTEIYFSRLYRSLVVEDLWEGLIKATIFGGVISLVSCYFGLAARGGAESVGRAATKAVVISLTVILVCDFLIGRFIQSWLQPNVY